MVLAGKVALSEPFIDHIQSGLARDVRIFVNANHIVKWIDTNEVFHNHLAYEDELARFIQLWEAQASKYICILGILVVKLFLDTLYHVVDAVLNLFRVSSTIFDEDWHDHFRNLIFTTLW